MINYHHTLIIKIALTPKLRKNSYYGWIVRPTRVIKLGRNILERSVRQKTRAKKIYINEDQKG